ncbi:MAG: carbon monoxide dehydrogenase subunit G [Gammaproteobacteria bacterium]|nr:carbon monoxide dehydrogenase subunit G [Gammaproteobacteria bacterium]
MEIRGEQRLAHPREDVWAALIDPEVLGACVPGCKSFDRVADDQYRASMQADIGPVSAGFAVEIRIADPDPPHSYRLEGSAKAAVGFGRGQADVRLEEDGQGGTKLSYVAKLQLGGKLAQVGSRLLSGITRKIAANFFERFAEVLEGKRPAGAKRSGESSLGASLGRLFENRVSRWAIPAVLLVLGALAVFLLLSR